MTRKEAKKMSGDGELPKFYAQFIAFAGNVLSKTQYQRVLEEFFYLTIDVYISGIGCREKCMGKFCVWMQDKHPTINPSHVFYSVDAVHAYT